MVIGAASKSRMAGDLFKWLKNTIKYGATGSVNPSRRELFTQLGLRLTPDAIGGTMYGMSTPGDLGDKIIAGVTDTALGSIAGIGVSGGLRGLTKGSKIASYATDMVGSYGGIQAAYPVAEQILKAKDKMSGGQGLSPYEKLDVERTREIEMNLLRQLGMA